MASIRRRKSGGPIGGPMLSPGRLEGHLFGWDAVLRGPVPCLVGWDLPHCNTTSHHHHHHLCLGELVPVSPNQAYLVLGCGTPPPLSLHSRRQAGLRVIPGLCSLGRVARHRHLTLSIISPSSASQCRCACQRSLPAKKWWHRCSILPLLQYSLLERNAE